MRTMSTPSRRTFVQLLAGALATALAPPIPALAATSTIPFRVVRRLRGGEDARSAARLRSIQHWLQHTPKDHPQRWIVKELRYALLYGAQPTIHPTIQPTALIERLDTGRFGITWAWRDSRPIDPSMVQGWFDTAEAALASAGDCVDADTRILMVDDLSLLGVG